MIGNFMPTHPMIQKAGGGLGIVTAAIAYYVGASELMPRHQSYVSLLSVCFAYPWSYGIDTSPSRLTLFPSETSKSWFWSTYVYICASRPCGITFATCVNTEHLSTLRDTNSYSFFSTPNPNRSHYTKKQLALRKKNSCSVIVSCLYSCLSVCHPSSEVFFFCLLLKHFKIHFSPQSIPTFAHVNVTPPLALTLPLCSMEPYFQCVIPLFARTFSWKNSPLNTHETLIRPAPTRENGASFLDRVSL